MTRLFGACGLLIVVSASLALTTGLWFFKVLTLVLGAAVLGLYAFLRRSMPRYRGSLSLPGLKEPVEVYWDDHGIPHVYARNPHDLYMSQGYLTAQERLWSMDYVRRVAVGRTAEILGDQVLHLDKHFRTLGLRRSAEASWALYSEESQAHLQAYAEGVNARIREGRLPLEFTLLRYRPAEWTAIDSISVSKYIAYNLSGNWDRELFRAHLVKSVGAKFAAELFWLPPDERRLEELEHLDLPDFDELLSIAAATLNETSGSNGWVVSGSKTQTGASMLANDPHLAVATPAVWYEMHLVGPGDIDVVGVSFPGVPGIMLGQNKDIAWGTTNLLADQQDVYLHRMNPDAPDEYLLDGAWQKAERVVEEIRVRGKAAPVTHEVLITRQGPIIARSTGPDRTAVALYWAALEPTTDIEAFLRINRARGWSDFREALRQYTAPAQQFLFAGRDGKIAWRAGGKIPIRQAADGQAPIPGWDSGLLWSEYIPFDDLPEMVDPPEGFLVASNHGVLPENFPANVVSGWLPPYRSLRLRERLMGATNLTVDKMAAIQMDCVNVHARASLELLLNALQEGLRQGKVAESLNPTEKRALLILSGWDGCEGDGAPEPALWHQWYLFLVEGIFRPRMGLQLFDQFVACGMPMQITDRLIRHVVEGGESLWLPREGEDSLRRVALRSFRRAVAFLAAKQGSQPDRWRWGREHTVRFDHVLAAGVSSLKWLVGLGPFAISGSTHTLNNRQLSQLNPFRVNVAPTWRHIADLSPLHESQRILAPGQSGHPLSPHFADQLQVWLKGEYTVQLSRHKTVRTLASLVLHPADRNPRR